MQRYKWDAEDYESYSRSQQKWGQELITKLDLKGDEHVLDIGCGDGKLTAEIAKKLYHGKVIGIDNSDEMIDLAVKRYPSNRYPNLSFQILDAGKLKYKEEFDIVYSNAVLHWISDHIPVLNGIYKSLKKGGLALLQMGGAGNAEKILDILSGIIKNDPWKKYFQNFVFPYSFYSPDEYLLWINDVGFKKIRIELIPKDMLHIGQSELEGWIRTTWLPYLKPIPRTLQTAFIKEIAEKYMLENSEDEDGMVHVKMIRLEVEIIKPL